MPVRAYTTLLKLLGTVVLAVASAPLSCAKVVTVDCSGATPGAFTSLDAALSTLPLQGPNSVTITGTCTAGTGIVGFNELVLQGSGTAIIKVDPRFVDALDITHSRVFVFGPLVLDGGGINIQEHSEVFLAGVTIQNSRFYGISSTDSVLNINTSTIENNAAEGISVKDGRVQTVGVTITGNHNAGIFARHAHVELLTFAIAPFQPTAVRNNTGVGLWLTEGSLGQLEGFSFEPGEDISGNTGDGIFVEDTSVLATNGRDTISNNGGDGVQLKGLALAHLLGPDTVTGNGGFSLHCDNTSLIEADVSALTHVKCSRIASR